MTVGQSPGYGEAVRYVSGIAVEMGDPNPLAPDATHSEIADHYAQRVTAASGERPVYDLGALYAYDRDAGIWRAQELDQLAAAVGSSYTGQKLCRKHSDYRQIAQLIATTTGTDDFFSTAPAGIAADGKFYQVAEDGEICADQLVADHRQRTMIPVAPEFEVRAPLFELLLDNAFGHGDGGDAQRELLQMGMGAALCGFLWRLRTVLMLFGPTSTGKSTLLEILKSFFPRDRVGSVNPQSWGNEYHAAALAGLSLNLVGELDPTTPIPGGIFKSVTGCDPVGARHPTHRPFSFVCMAAHIFNCNRLPPTRDKSAAYFRRWRILEFTNSIAPGKEIIGLAERIVQQEQAAVLGWLLEGAARLARDGHLPETANHRRLTEYWREANNSALQFVLDREYVEPASATHSVPAQEVYNAYKRWGTAAGIKVMGRNAFYDALLDAGRHGVAISEDFSGLKVVSGLSLQKST